MNRKELEAFAKIEAAKSIKTQGDLNDFSRTLKQITVETTLNAELDDHQGYDKHQKTDNSNTRNGYSTKTRPCAPRLARLISIHHVTAKMVLSRN